MTDDESKGEMNGNYIWAERILRLNKTVIWPKEMRRNQYVQVTRDI